MVASLAWPLQIALFAAGPPLAALFPLTVLAGLCLGLFAVWWQTALAQRIPPHLLSRVGLGLDGQPGPAAGRLIS